MRETLGLLAGACAAVLVLCTLAGADDEREADASTSVGTIETKIPAVFNVPPAVELAQIANSELRLELLSMAHEDQVARSAGT